MSHRPQGRPQSPDNLLGWAVFGHSRWKDCIEFPAHIYPSQLCWWRRAAAPPPRYDPVWRMCGRVASGVIMSVTIRRHLVSPHCVRDPMASWDLYMQAGHQTQAHRLRCYFESAELRARVFPGAFFAAAAEEIGPRSEHIGPCTVRFTALELPPLAVLTWFHTSLLRRHFTRLYWLRAPPPPPTPGGEDSCARAAQPQACNSSSSSGDATKAQVAGSSHGGAAEEDDGCGPGCCSCSRDCSSREELLQDIIDSAGSTSGSTGPGVVLRLQCYPRDLEKFLQVCSGARTSPIGGEGHWLDTGCRTRNPSGPTTLPLGMGVPAGRSASC